MVGRQPNKRLKYVEVIRIFSKHSSIHGGAASHVGDYHQVTSLGGDSFITSLIDGGLSYVRVASLGKIGWQIVFLQIFSQVWCYIHDGVSTGLGYFSCDFCKGVEKYVH